jgi:hypothetical protein
MEVEPPKLLVEWSSPWKEFRSAVGPALARSGRPLAGEARTGLFPYRGVIASWCIEILLLGAIMVLPQQYSRIRPTPPPVIPKYDVIYFSGDELPRTEDSGGARAGRAGLGGGAEARHRTQAIRVAREDVPREKIADAPKLDLPHSDSAVANLLAYKGIPGPVPTQGLKSSSRTPSLEMPAIAPPPTLQMNKAKTAPALQAQVVPPPVAAPESSLIRPPKLTLPSDVIAPPPSEIQNRLTSRITSTSLPSVIQPPVSAPEKDLGRSPKLVLPAAVIEPPPSQTPHDLLTTRGFTVDLHKTAVPPPVQVNGVPSQRTVSGYGNTPVVAPPVRVNDAPMQQRKVPAYGSASVVAPPVALNGIPVQQRNSAGLGGASVVPPPVQANLAPSSAKRVTQLIGDPSVVAPAPSLTASAHSSSGRGNRPGMLGADDIAAPPPSKEPVGTGIIVSSQPGTKVGSPTNAAPGSLALSPSGGQKAGVGGGGGGSGIAHGTGPGSGLADAGPGVAKEGTGHGADTVARSGNSPYAGGGGSGSATTNNPSMPGVSVRGGSNNIITLPSFGGAPDDPSGPGRSPSAKEAKGPAVTIVATSRSGGAFNFYGALKGDKVYTIYIDTALGTAVMQFADPASAAHPYAEDLTAPQPLKADLPPGLKRSRLVIACIMDRAGTLRSTQVLEPGDAVMTAKVLAALPKWKFTPAFRGDQPVEVNAILGFDIDTR